MLLRWLLWTVFVAIWTALLVTPASLHDELPLGEFVLTNRAVLSKIIHIGGFGVFTALTGWLRVPIGYRPALMFLVMLHAAGTEFIQESVPGRSGSLSDVLFNSLGIALGLAASWKWWTRE